MSFQRGQPLVPPIANRVTYSLSGDVLTLTVADPIGLSQKQRKAILLSAYADYQGLAYTEEVSDQNFAFSNSNITAQVTSPASPGSGFSASSGNIFQLVRPGNFHDRVKIFHAVHRPCLGHGQAPCPNAILLRLNYVSTGCLGFPPHLRNSTDCGETGELVVAEFTLNEIPTCPDRYPSVPSGDGHHLCTITDDRVNGDFWVTLRIFDWSYNGYDADREFCTVTVTFRWEIRSFVENVHPLSLPILRFLQGELKCLGRPSHASNNENCCFQEVNGSTSTIWYGVNDTPLTLGLTESGICAISLVGYATGHVTWHPVEGQFPEEEEEDIDWA